MARTPLLNLRVDEATKTRWQDHAEKEGIRLAEMIRLYVEAGIAASRSEPRKRAPARATRPQGSAKAVRARTEICEHRRRPDEYCSRCDV